jgi:hypothetical protein
VAGDVLAGDAGEDDTEGEDRAEARVADGERERPVSERVEDGLVITKRTACRVGAHAFITIFAQPAPTDRCDCGLTRWKPEQTTENAGVGERT